MKNDTEWLRSLKPGDEVIVVSRNGATYSLHRVHRVMPSGRIVITTGSGSTEYNADGWRRGGDSWNRSYLAEPTPERREKAERRALLEQLRYVRWEELDTATLRAVADALKPQQ